MVASARLSELLEYVRMEGEALSGMVEASRRENGEYAGQGELHCVARYTNAALMLKSDWTGCCCCSGDARPGDGDPQGAARIPQQRAQAGQAEVT